MKFHQAASVLSVDLCFGCRTLRVLRDGREIAAKNFDFGRDGLYTVMFRYFPDLGVKEANQPLQRNAGSRPSSDDSSASETSSSLGPRG